MTVIYVKLLSHIFLNILLCYLKNGRQIMKVNKSFNALLLSQASSML